MKNLKVISTVLFAAFLFVSTATMAERPPKPSPATSQADLYSALEDVMNYPKSEVGTEASTDVWVTFSITEDGKIETKNVQGKEKFVEHVKKELSTVNLKNPYLHGKTYMIKIAFNYEER